MKQKPSGDRILLGHGSGGKLTARLVGDLFLRYFDNEHLNTLEDSAVVEWQHPRLAMTTDAFVIDPLFFPGGDIGKLSVCGTVNDVVAAGAVPLYPNVI